MLTMHSVWLRCKSHQHLMANDWSMTMSSTGEKPGKGTYYCKKCGQQVVLDDYDDTLPPCPKCSHTEYTK
ncbi:zinc ribbon-containing protein [Photobacterium alginatilyticum]|uniref:zinc ribbon-containing protein n=1 Tax=Photobacterium alginatilyticum TaxID=1775171 RepID=UPI004068DABC